jgi:hypothetical protein
VWQVPIQVLFHKYPIFAPERVQTEQVVAEPEQTEHRISQAAQTLGLLFENVPFGHVVTQVLLDKKPIYVPERIQTEQEVADPEQTEHKLSQTVQMLGFVDEKVPFGQLERQELFQR